MFNDKNDIHKCLDGGFAGHTEIKLNDGTIKQIKDIRVGDILENNISVYGIVEIDGRSLNGQYTFNLGNKIFEGGPNLTICDKNINVSSTLNLIENYDSYLDNRINCKKPTSKIENKLYHLGMHTYVLDGDNLRGGINKDLGFSESDRVENIRRIAEISKLMVDAGLVVIVSSISPFKRERDFAKSLFDKNEFYEIYINTPLKVCSKRDPKGIYKKSKKLSSFNKIGLTGVYEKPLNPFLKIDTTKQSALNSVKMILDRVFNCI
jgi:adenylyl-sulfate kinase